MSSPLVSAVIPTYNRENVVGQAVESALIQTYPHLEIIVVDDGSSDGTAGVLSKFGDRIRVIRQENAGPSAARNRGVEAARGEIIAYLDSDDTWSPSKIAEQVGLMEKLGPGVPCCLANISLPHAPYGRRTSFALSELRPGHERGVWLNPTQVLLTRFVLFNQAVAVRKWAMDEAGPFNPNLRLLEDYDLALRLSLLGPWAFLQAPLVNYGVAESNSLSNWGHSQPGRVPRVLQQVLLELQRSGMVTETTAVKLLERQIRMAAWSVVAAELVDQGRFLKSGAARLLKLNMRVRDALFRRSSAWPKMRTVSVDEYSRRHQTTASTNSAPALNPGT